jgi:hypothetical protein
MTSWSARMTASGSSAGSSSPQEPLAAQTREVAPDLPLDRRSLLEDVGGGHADTDDGTRGLEDLPGRNDHDGQDRDRHDHLDERETEPLHDAAATVARKRTAAETTAFWQAEAKKTAPLERMNVAGRGLKYSDSGSGKSGHFGSFSR